MANYRVKRTRIVCQHKEVLSLITTVYIDREGRYRHGARCEAELDYIGTGKTRGSETEVRFWCPACLESVALPILAFMRVEIRVGDTRGDRRSPLLDYGVVLAGDSVPAHDEGTRSRLHRAPAVRCKVCNLPHYVPPAS